MIIKTPKGNYFKIDDSDYDKIKHIKWEVVNKYVTGYCTEHNRQIYLHRLLTCLTKGDGKVIDHINRDSTDNRISNLRVCTQSQNLCNKAPRGASKYLGVSKWYNKWQARIRINGIQKSIGVFETELDAAKAYNEQAKLIHKEFANLNPII